jgi:methionine aminotransferase
MYYRFFIWKIVPYYGLEDWHLVAPEYLMKEIKKVHQFMVFSVNSICQVAISEYIDSSTNEIKLLYQEKRDYFISLTDSRFELRP